MADVDGGVVKTSCEPVPGTAVAVNTTGLPVSPVAVAFTTYCCAVLPSVHDVRAAMPDAFVVTVSVVPLVDAFAICAPAVTTSNVTTTPDTGLLDASVTSTAGGTGTFVPTGAVWLLPALSEMTDGAPALSTIVPYVSGT